MNRRPKVLYIGGTGRTGSTMLDRLLGTASGFFGAGELTFLWEHGVHGTCECGRSLIECPVWTKVLDATTDDPLRDAQRLTALRRKCRSAHLPLHAVPPLERRRLARLEEYPSALHRLYSAIAAVTGSRVIIDSSKEPHYSMILRDTADVDVYFLHLVRDPRAVGLSWSRPTQPAGSGGTRLATRGVWKTSAYYTVSNAGARWLWRSSPRYAVLRYEDLVKDPAAAIAAIGYFLDEPIDVSAALEGNRFLPTVGHMSWGNPNRFDSRPQPIAPDERWRKELSPWRRRAMISLNWPVAACYGYPLRSSKPLGTLNHEADILERYARHYARPNAPASSPH